jgi:hypothetical protein|tara:strand:+ start:710 stop:829 length:120 start_codon:yes stop_codon:yes gene_type:complete
MKPIKSRKIDSLQYTSEGHRVSSVKKLEDGKKLASVEKE